MQLLLNQVDIQGSGESLIGGKAKNLAWLSRFGFNVPPFLVVSTESFRKFLEHTMKKNFTDVMASLQMNPVVVAAEIRAALLRASLPEDLQAALRQSLGQFQDSFLAVRSSVVGEDSQEASFAGQMETFLFLKSYEEISRGIIECFASAFAERAIIYRKDRKLPIHSISAAVICQVMVDSDVAGVVFTAHPNRGNRNEQLISAAWGLGEGVVSGECNADEFVVRYQNQKPSLIEQKVADKDNAFRFASGQGYGTKIVKVEDKLRKVACLSQDLLIKLSQICYQIALKQGCPQDIEFALKDQTFSILQTRPITMLPVQMEGDPVVWDNSNIQESYCGVTTPLTFSFASRAYRSVYVNTGEIVGMSKSELANMDPILRNLLGLIRGRVYYNINNWYHGISNLPGFSANKQDMERMMGLQDPVDFVQKRQRHGWDALLAKFKSIRALSKLLSHFFRIRSLVEEFRSHFAESYLRVDKGQLFLCNLRELYELSKELENKIIMRWTTPIVNDFYVMMMNGKVHRKLNALKIENPSLTLNNLLSGEEGIESTEPTKFLLKMCDSIRSDAKLYEVFLATAHSELMAAIQQNFPAFHQLCLEYIELYGDRTMGELKLESITLRQDPAFMFACLRNYINNPKLSLASLERHEKNLRSDEELRIFSLLKSPLARLTMKRDLNRLRNAVKNRENMRLARTRLFGLYRCLYLEMGKQLALHKVLKHQRDIFYLTVEEIEQFFEGRSTCISLDRLAELRRQEFAEYEAMDLPHHFKTYGSPYVGNRYEYSGATLSVTEGASLQGLGCYPGVVEGKIRLIFSPEDEMSLQGQILCTVRTDPGWAPLFPSAAGIIVERGSSLSHSAVVARELGIPAIVNIPGLTSILKDGERIRMNGQTGVIERLDFEAGNHSN